MRTRVEPAGPARKSAPMPTLLRSMVLIVLLVVTPVAYHDIALPNVQARP